MNEALMERLQKFLSREDRASLVGCPATQEEISHAEQLLNVSFHEDYLRFIRMFGGAYAGLPIHAFSNGSSIGNETIVDLTLDFREQCKELPFGEELRVSYVISIDGSGDPIIIDQTGKVFICYHDTGEVKFLADSFEALIEDNFYEW
ncbi:SMI1/KNR4 family protein [Paenibacillus solani]|uniref:Cell wall assembly protein n=1 Tax=Paenibacillus solani TaxID=1705565 RepID=A0A0M1P3U7_9BACL|nr:SMI1/KNR4 family protein [Paenibacillus solani]KOR89161.1 cell wall assembly protein [Paenibacillus solani]